jgi:hypothetical protein
MKLANRFFVAVGVILALTTSAVRADTLNLPVRPPITFNDRIDIKYAIESTVVGDLGKLTANGRSVSVTGGSAPLPGTFSLTAYFNRTTGVIIQDHVNNLFDPTLDVRDSTNTVMYFSRHLNRFASDLGVSLPTFDFEFFNEGGTMPALNPQPFIGVTLRSGSSYTGTLNFISALPAGSTVFNNNLVGGLETGTANVFMTPTPTAVGGGFMLLGCLVIGAQMRRRSSEIE